MLMCVKLFEAAWVDGDEKSNSKTWEEFTSTTTIVGWNGEIHITGVFPLTSKSFTGTWGIWCVEHWGVGHGKGENMMENNQER